MVQIVDLASDAFQCASRDMGAIRMQTNIMFGTSGHVQAIPMSLQDSRIAKLTLMDNMKKFEDEMHGCAKRTREIEGAFDKMIKCARELNEAMANEMTSAKQEQDLIEFDMRKTKVEKEIQQQAVEVLRGRAQDSQREMEEARKVFQKKAKKGEWSALALGTVADMQGAVTSVLHAAISVAKETPKLATEVVRAVGHIGNRGNVTYVDGNAQGPNFHATAQTPDVGIDPALLAAEKIERQLSNLNELLRDDLVSPIQDSGSKILACSKQFENLNQSLGDFKSRHTVNAKSILDDAIEITSSILKHKGSATSQARVSPEWQSGAVAEGGGRITMWSNQIEVICGSSARPRFGGTMNTATAGIGAKDAGYTKVLKARHEKLLIMRTAMKDAQENLPRSTEMQLSAQAKVIEFVKVVDDLDNRTATLDQTKDILRKSIDLMTSMQDQVKTLAGFFEVLADIISIVGVSQARQFLDTTRAGITQSSNGIEIGFHESQISMIRETLLTLRGHFGFVVKSADLYQEIATVHINPCLRMAALLPLSASPEEQIEVKKQLKEATDESAAAIQALAKRELDSYNQQLEDRCKEIEADIGKLPELEDELGTIQAIQEGVKEASEETMGEVAENCELDLEITDDL